MPKYMSHFFTHIHVSVISIKTVKRWDFLDQQVSKAIASHIMTVQYKQTKKKSIQTSKV